MAEPTVLSLKCPSCGAALRGLQQDVVFWCNGCGVPYEIVGTTFVGRQGEKARAALPSRGATLYLPMWVFRVSSVSQWEDPDRAALPRHVPRIDWVYVTGFTLHNAFYFGDPGLIFTQKQVALEAEASTHPGGLVLGCTRSLEEAKAYVQPHVLTIIDRRVDVTGLELSCSIDDAALWGIPFFDGGDMLWDGILGLKIPTAALDEMGAIRECAARKT